MATTSLARPARALISSGGLFRLTIRPSKQALNYLRSLEATPVPISLSSVRHASHQAQGRANGPKSTAGRRLGAKKTGEQFVVPGNIIYRQRGTLWFPGENCAMGRDHTIYATEKGFVKYYKDPAKHPDRKYIGVALERDLTLPTPYNSPRRRRLNMLAVPINSAPSHLTDNYVSPPISIAGAETGGKLPKGMTLEPTGLNGALRPTFTTKDGTILKMRENYMFREDNWAIGRAAERAGIRVRPFKKNDRWLAWRKRTVRRAKAAERKAMIKGKGGKKKQKAAPKQAA